ncbi:GNAT family N-acetyltransferase [Aneurinibacillus sp. REN35]|uniref:GNAT family N-acetyltransferase n=1 Tax=Aneurinibacillus sp. REN35 TaxID=3237286 RepID=UPI003526FE58
MVEIREAQRNDVAAMLSIYNHAIRTSNATFDIEELTLTQRMEWFSHYGGRHPLLVAQMHDRVIGYSCLSPFRTKPAYAQTAELSVYIDAAYQGQGIGKALVKELLVRAKEHKYHAIIAGITGGNETSVKLHEGFGFTLVGHFKEVGHKFGTWQDVFFYELLLDHN